LTPLERAARALAHLHGRDPDEPVLLAGDRRLWQEFVPQARAVIEAIREPSEGMRDAAFKREVEFRTTMGNLDRGYCEGDGVWQVMIDELLAEGE